MSDAPGCSSAFCLNITWKELAWPLLFWPLITQLALFVLLLPLQLLFSGKVSRWQTNYIGTTDSPPVHKVLINLFYIVQMFCSGAHTCIWVHRTYTHKIDPTGKWVEVGLCCFFAIHYLLNGLKSQWDKWYVLSRASFVDVLTIFPVFYYVNYDPVDIPWITLSYFRIYRCVLAYDRVEKTGILNDFSDVTRGAIIMTFKFLSLVTILGGTVMMLEILGDPSFLAGTEFTDTDFGAISFVQMFYWICTTISTVGYGDFSPKTVLSQLFSPVCIIVGVTFFTQETNEMLNLLGLEDAGKGRFTPQPTGSEHLVVVGGGVSCCSAILENFLQALYHEDDHDHPFPNCVLMAPGEASPQLKEFLSKLPKHARTRVKYFAGSCMSSEDLDRVRLNQAKLGIVICDTQSGDPDQEDQGNILRAIAMKRFVKTLDLRLMLLRPESKARAVQVGIRAARCFSVNEMKSNLLAVSCRCAGWTTMIANFMTTVQVGDRKEENEESWFSVYEKGHRTRMNGFCVGSQFVGKSFQDLAAECFASGLAPIAVQVEGKIKLNPSGHMLKENDVVFALGDSHDAVKAVSNMHEQWASVFSKAQSQSAPTSKHSRMASMMGSEKQFISAESDVGRGAASNEPDAPPSARVAGGPIVIAAGLNYHAAHGSAGVLPGQGVQDRIRKRQVSRQQPDSARSGASSRAFGKLSDDDLYEMEEMSRLIIEKGDHILLVVLSSTTVWQQVQAFTRGVRMGSLPRQTPLIVLSSELPDREVFNEIYRAYDSVGVVVGAPHKSSDMLRAGMHVASTVILLAGRPSIDDWRMVDGNGVMMLQTLESQTKAAIVLELLNEESALLLTRLPHALEDSMSAKASDKKSGIDISVGAAKKAAEKRMKDELANISNIMNYDDQAQEQRDDPFNFLPRFAGGNLFCASCLGALVAVANYVPGVIELTEAMVSGEDTGQSCFPWQIRVPQEYVGKTYLQFAVALLKGFPDSGQTELSAVPLGIYRKKDSAASNDATHVITNPPASLTLQATDLVFVLGSHEFAEACFKASPRVLSGVFEHEEILESPRNLQNAEDDNVTTHATAFGLDGPSKVAEPADGIPVFIPPDASQDPRVVTLDGRDGRDGSGNWTPYCCVPQHTTGSEATVINPAGSNDRSPDPARA